MQMQSTVQVMGIDAGGTMTDTFFVRDDGRFVVGKAQSNPGDESLAIYNSSVDALAHWNRTVDDVYPELATCVYSGTAMLNRILMRKGLDVGLICNRGFEQIHSMGRALQSYLGYALEDRIHLNTHRYDEPLVPVSRTRGVAERTDVQGKIVIPLREEEVRQATRELVEAGSQAIVICLLQSHKNETSEQRARDIVRALNGTRRAASGPNVSTGFPANPSICSSVNPYAASACAQSALLPIPFPRPPGQLFISHTGDSQ